MAITQETMCGMPRDPRFAYVCLMPLAVGLTCTWGAKGNDGETYDVRFSVEMPYLEQRQKALEFFGSLLDEKPGLEFVPVRFL